ncbi:MAG: flagellar hook-associated protein FlgL [Rhodocyclaceae bacterium]|nr:flagellar hook-associated protein FlgL [Rhodocyclaceae bacterium]
MIRVSTSMIFNAGVNAMNTQTAMLLHLQQQVASGRRMLTPADDPVGAARALEVTQAKDVTAQYAINHDNAKSALGLEEAQLTGVNSIMARLKELTVQAGNAALSAGDRRGVALELRARFDELLGIANATDGAGQHLFAGYMGSTKPFGASIDAMIQNPALEATYQGDDGQRRLQVSATRFLEIGDSGNDVFMRIRNGNGYFATDYVAGNAGTAVIDAGNVTNTTAWNALADKNLNVTFSIDMVAVPPVTYYDIIGTSGNSLLTGLPPVLPPTAATGQNVYQANQPIVIPGAGASITISGAPVDGDSFSLAPSTSQSLFRTLANLVGALESGPTGTGSQAKYSNEIGLALTNLDQANDNILRVRAAIGSRLNEVDSLSDVNQDLQLQYQQTLSNLQDLDYAKAISDLTRKQTDLEAAQKSFMRVSQLSLFNYL